jgi:hypothetical protein
MRQRSAEWSARIMHELDFHQGAVFVTLTYNDYHMPENGQISKRELQLFIKRLRKKLDKKISYFACGEYGEKTGRPHYHLIIFNMRPGSESEELIKEAWQYQGFIKLGTVTVQSARYVTNYILKSLDKRTYVNNNVQQPFQLVSQGFGKRFALENAERIIEELNIQMNGQSVGLPRYYQRILGIDASLLGEKAVARNLELLKDIQDKYPEMTPHEIYVEIWKRRKQARKNFLARERTKSNRPL